MAWRGLAGGAAGAAAYQAYQGMDTGIMGNTGIASGLYEALRRGGTHPESMKMQKQIEDLQSMLLKSFQERSSGSSTIVIQSPNRTSTSTAVGFLVIVGGIAVYFRFVKGWRLTDLMYVTRSSLATLKSSMAEGMQKMQEQVRATTEELQKRLGNVSKKQDELMESQQVMDATLNRVEENVGQVNRNVYLLQDQVAYSNQAVTLLCGAVAEVAKRVSINGRYTRALEGFTRIAPPSALAGGPVFDIEGPAGTKLLAQAGTGGEMLLLEQGADGQEQWYSADAASITGAQQQRQQQQQQQRQRGAAGAATGSGDVASSSAGASSSGAVPSMQQQPWQQWQPQVRPAGPNPAVFAATADLARTVPGVASTVLSADGSARGQTSSPAQRRYRDTAYDEYDTSSSPASAAAAAKLGEHPQAVVAKRADTAPPKVTSAFGGWLRGRQ